MKIFTDKRMLQAGLIGGTLSRHSGCMREIAHQAPVYQQLGIDPTRILHFHQTHSTRVVTISNAQAAQAHPCHPLIDADAWLFSPAPAGWGAAILTADCVPVFIWDVHAQHFALAHCGWRGVVGQLAYQTANTLIQTAPHTTWRAYLGPHIQVCCFEVQADVANQFPSDCIVRKNGKLFVNLTAALTQQLVRAGISPQNIYAPDYCTCGDAENFFSWRRDHQNPLLLSFIYKP